MHRWYADRCGVELARRQTGFDAVEAGNAKVRGGFGGDCRMIVDDRNQLEVATGLLQFAIDSQVVAPEGPRSDDRHAQWLRQRHLLRGDRRFDRPAATAVKLQQVRHLVLGFG